LDNAKNNYKKNEMIMDCNNYIEDEEEVSMKKCNNKVAVMRTTSRRRSRE